MVKKYYDCIDSNLKLLFQIGLEDNDPKPEIGNYVIDLEDNKHKIIDIYYREDDLFQYVVKKVPSVEDRLKAIEKTLVSISKELEFQRYTNRPNITKQKYITYKVEGEEFRVPSSISYMLSLD